MKTKNSRTSNPWLWLVLLTLVCPGGVSGQAVVVTLRLDTNQIVVGSTTTLHVMAQVAPAQRAAAERIFAWYVDVLNTNGTTARGNYSSLLRLASDNDPLTSSAGADQGSNRRGIYDTFLNRPGAGVSNVVELLTVSIAGIAPGRTRFLASAGHGVAALSGDFLVATRDGNAVSGGDYSAALADLQVIGSGCQVPLQLVRLANNRIQLTFPPCAGRNHFVEFTPSLASPRVWQALPGTPHNSGSILVTNSLSGSFFRVRVQ